MENTQYSSIFNASSYGDKKSGETAVYDPKMTSRSLDVNGSLQIYVDEDLPSPGNDSESQDKPLLFRNTFGKKKSSNSHELPVSDAASGYNVVFPNYKITADEQKKIDNDLLQQNLPWDFSDPTHQQRKRDVNHINSAIVNDGKRLMGVNFDADKGYTSDNTDLGQTQHIFLQNGMGLKSTKTKLNENPSSNVQNNLSDYSKHAPNIGKHLRNRSKKSDGNMKHATKNISNNENNHDMSNFSRSPSSHHSESDGRQLENKATTQRVQTTSHPGNSKFAKSKNRSGGLSDDEYIINISTAHHGRRSAPIFNKRVFSASEFWNSGQTAIERSHLQDIASARIQERQMLKSPTNKHESKYSHKPCLQRPHSVDVDSFLNEIKEGHAIKQSVQSSRGREKKRLVTYGSTYDTGRIAEHRGYLSENETRDLRHTDNQRRLDEDGYKSNGNLVWNINDNDENANLFDDVAFENPTQDAARTHGMRGLFRIPHTITPHVFHTKVTQGQDATIIGKKPYGYIPEDDSRNQQKQSFAQDSDDDTIDEDSNESAEDKISEEKSSDELFEEKLEIKSDVRTEVYKRRWYLLFLFSITAMLWNAIWSTWGPIAQSAKAVYNWDDGDIAMFTYLGNIPFLITMFPCAYLMDVSGMRVAMIFCCIFMFIGSGFRCIPGDIVTSTWLIRIGQLLNGMAGTIPSSGPALLSGLWFPPNQRATATAVSTVAGYMGASISFIIGPLIVPEPNKQSPVNGSDGLYDYEDIFIDNNRSGGNNISYSDQEDGIKKILYGECGLAGLMLLLVLIYFPSKPPLPPSISASIPREKYLNGLKLLVRNKQFWICAIAFSVPIGVYESWQVILDINLESKGISQQTAGWLDFYATVGGCASGLLVSRFADLFIRQMKLFLLVFYSFATVAVLWFTLVVLEIIPFDQVSIYAAIIIAGVFLDGGSPLFFELTIEVSYPVGEGVTSGFTHMMCAAAGTVFLIIVQINNIGTEWMNWCFFGCVAMTIPLLMFINTSYARADIDDMEIDNSDDEEDLTSISASVANEKTSLLKNSTV